jgi:biopolymer transport protein ExbB
MWEELQTYLGSGGFVMAPLLLLAAVLWYMLGYRVCNLWLSPWRTDITDSLRRQTDPIIGQYVLEQALVQVEQSFARGRTLIQTICIVAPLAGLLGTVSGMIETFDSLAEMSLFSQSGGIAGGISEALFTTQMGLIVAVPGVLLGRVLDRHADKLTEKVEKEALSVFRSHFAGEVQ